MASRRPLAYGDDGRPAVIPSADEIDGVGDLYSGNTNPPTRYDNGRTRRYVVKGTTDSNGRATFNLTKEGTATGTPLFAEILSAQATPIYSGSDPNGAARFVIESVAVNLKTISVRGLAFLSVLGLLSISFAPTGAQFYLHIDGRPA